VNILSLNGSWKIRWSTGQRGGSPFVIKNADDSGHMNEVLGIKRKLPGVYREHGWLDAIVPGDVHLDLIKQGLLDDPYVGINIFKARWVEECVWHYRRTFDAPVEAVKSKSILTFKGLDLNAIIYLNGEEVGRHNNAFCACIIDVTSKLKLENNELVVRLESGLFDVCDKPIRNTFTASGSMDILLHKRVWLRKPQSHTEWDWSPRLLNVGIFNDVLLSYDKQIVITQSSIRNQVSKDLSFATIEARLFAMYSPGTTGKFRVVVTSAELISESFYDSVPEEGFCCKLDIENPILWYPIGYGDHHLYDIQITLYENDRVIFTKEAHTGLRNVEVRQNPHPIKGHYFVILVNSIPIFFKGSNFVPNDIITAAISTERYDKLTNLALEANFNSLRVWGGGIYEADDFFEICDKKGILVWQEFISACGPLPISDDDFLDDLKVESTYNIRRLSVHPSLIVWCGNNEITPYDSPLYMDIYRELVAKEDPEKYYQPSSPYTCNSLENVPQNKANWDWAGDQHPWSIGFLDKDHRGYRKMECRFPNEGGILGPTSLPTMLDCTGGKEPFNDSMSWDVHDNMLSFWKDGTSPDEDLFFWMKIRPEDISLEEYVFGGGFVQGEGLSDYIDNFRRRAFDSSSAIFWMFNDCWPCSRSWTIVDYRLNRTPSFYHVKRAFNPLRVVLVQDEKFGEIKIYGINFSMSNFNGNLRIGSFTCAGDIISDESCHIELAANSSSIIAYIAAIDISPTSEIPFAILYDNNDTEISKNRLLNYRYFEYPLELPDIRIQKEPQGYSFISDVYVMGVCLDLNGETPYGDNMFDLYPHIPYYIESKIEPVIKYTVNDLLKNTSGRLNRKDEK